jgi:hypothetical protein
LGDEVPLSPFFAYLKRKKANFGVLSRKVAPDWLFHKNNPTQTQATGK